MNLVVSWATTMFNLLYTSVLLLLGSTSLANQPLDLRVSLVQNNPGEGHTLTKYSDPHVVSELGYNVMVKQDGRPPHTAITWESFDPTIFPNGSAGRQWVEDLAEVIDNDIQQIHIAGMKAIYWFDMFVLPKTLVKKYNESITSGGKWSLESDQMVNITLYMLDAVFQRFPDLDGLLIRTGEIYTFDVPYHVGASPITDGYKSHIKLLQTLEEIVIKKYNKLLLYRTWSFDGFVSDPTYYLNVTDVFEPHPNLYFVIKHTAADFWRTVKFNPTLDIGKHQYLVEIQCQREYESKGATPNYVMNGVIDGFEEYHNTKGKRGIKDLVGSDKFKGVVTWARGGGWEGPYPANEYWIDMNVKVIAKWAQNPWQSEEDVFGQVYEDLDGDSLSALRQLALQSAHGVLLGHYSLVQQLQRLEWTRDSYIGGFDREIAAEGEMIVGNGTVDAVLHEKQEALNTWDKVQALAQQVKVDDPNLRDFIDHSITYAQLYYKLIATSWTVGLKGIEGNKTGQFDVDAIRTGIQQYDDTLAKYNGLSQCNQTHTVSSLYVPLDSDLVAKPKPPYTGANSTVDLWRFVIDQGT